MIVYKDLFKQISNVKHFWENKSLGKGKVLTDNDVLRVESIVNGAILGVVNVEKLKSNDQPEKNLQNLIIENSKYQNFDPNKPESARCLKCKEFCAGTYREQSKVGEHDRKEDSREDTRSIDKLVRDIEGTQEKKKKKRQRTKVKKVENLKDGVKIGKPSYDVDKIEK